MNGDQVLSNGLNIPNKITVVLGAQWGDEGKGKVVDMLGKDADMVCRCQVKFLQFLVEIFPKIFYNMCAFFRVETMLAIP